MTEPETFEARRRVAIEKMAADSNLRALTERWFRESCRHQYSYNFTWLGLPFIQFPQDILAMQEIIWRVRPEVIIETGVARGGSMIFYASMLELLGANGRVIGVDIDIRSHNRQAIEQHPLAKRIELLQGSSIQESTVCEVRRRAKGSSRVLVVLDSMHTHEHVLRELQLYSPLVQRGSYIVVFDTVIEHVPAELCTDRPWGPGNNPKTAVWEFLKQTDRFEIDRNIEHKLLLTVAPDGYLRCIKD